MASRSVCSEYSRELPNLLSTQHATVRDAIEAERRAGMEAVVRSRRKLQDGLATAARVDPEVLVEVANESYSWRVLGECAKVTATFEYGTHRVMCQASLRFGAES